MIDDIISQCLRDFQSDCLRLCEQHYPTVHNRGMKESHLGKALSRRFIHAYEDMNISASFIQLKDASSMKQTVFHIDSPDHEIFIVAHPLISASLACRRGLVKNLGGTLDHLNINNKKDTRFILISNHWIDRSAASKSIPSWWLGHQPIHVSEYAAQGIKLVDATHSLAADLRQDIQLNEGYHRIYHPFYRHRDGLTLFKYMILTAVYPLNIR